MLSILLSILTEVSDGGSGLVIDLRDFQAWQIVVGAILGILGGLGLSPAPWLVGLAAGKIQFSAGARRDFERQLKDQDVAHARELTERDAAHAREVEALHRYHEALMAAQMQRYADLERSNAANAAATEEQTRRADRATEVMEVAIGVIEASNHLISSYQAATRIVAEEQTDGR